MNDRSKCPNGLEHGNCLWPGCVASCPGRISLLSLCPKPPCTAFPECGCVGGEIESLRLQFERVPVAKPVAFRVPRVIDDKLSKTEHRLFKDEDEARQAATEIGADYDGLYLVADRRAAFFAQPDPAAELEKLRSQFDSAHQAMRGIIEANNDFRAGMPPDWEGDLLQDAIDAARLALSDEQKP